MGAWGTAILSDDLAADVYGEYMEMFDEGHDHTEIRNCLQSKYHETIEDVDEAPVFWLTLAKAQWTCAALQPDVSAQVRNIVENGLGLDLWEEQGTRLLQKRKSVVEKLFQVIQTPRPKPRKRKKPREYKAIYEPGDCLCVQLEDGDYGAALVLAAQIWDGVPCRLIGTMNYKSSLPPGLFVFESRNWLHLTHHSYNGKVEIIWYIASPKKKERESMRVVGRTSLRGGDPVESSWWASWNRILDEPIAQAKWDRGEREQ